MFKLGDIVNFLAHNNENIELVSELHPDKEISTTRYDGSVGSLPEDSRYFTLITDIFREPDEV